MRRIVARPNLRLRPRQRLRKFRIRRINGRLGRLEEAQHKLRERAVDNPYYKKNAFSRDMAFSVAEIEQAEAELLELLRATENQEAER